MVFPGCGPQRLRRFGVQIPAQFHPLGQLTARFFVTLVFQQSFHQLGPGVFPLLRLFVYRQQHFGFDVHQLGGHGHEFAGHFQIQLFHLGQMVQILLQDLGDGDIVDADFVFRDQVEQQIQRPIKRIQMIGHLLCGHGSDHPKQAQQAADAPDDQVEHIDLQRGH